MLLPPDTEKKLKKFLALSPNPEDTFSYDELLGFLFGLAMTPEIVLPDEWLPIIFGGEKPAFNSAKQAELLTDCLLQVYNSLVDAFHDDRLDFPIDLASLVDDQLLIVYEWVSGLDEALTLRASLWEPEILPKMAKAKQEELYFSLMIVEGLVDPEELTDFFANLPDDFLQESFPGMDAATMDREMQIQMFLLASLPLAVRTLQDHARALAMKRRQPGKEPVQLSAFRSRSVRQPASCHCDHAGQAGSCCDAGVGRIKTAAPAGGKKANVIKVDFPRHGQKTRDDVPAYQLKIALQGAKPPIWRRVLVPGDFTLVQLHKVIQLSMGWTDSHLHQFLIDRDSYGLPEDDSTAKNEAKFTLQALEGKIRNGFGYVYDFGDGWLHQITLEKVIAPGQGQTHPVLISGRRACPPEDAGGLPGYLRLLEILADPDNDEYQEYKDWLGEDFAPERFGKEEISLINVVLEEIYA